MSIRVTSGSTTHKIGFVAVDATDFSTRETGLTSFTVYRSRNGGTATVMTTPTITELSAGNMPGCYTLTLDEDTTIDSGYDTQEMLLHITHTGMAPVTISVELYRSKITTGNTLDVTSTGAAGIDWGNVENPSTSVDLSATAINLCDTVTTNTDMRGTDSALLASSAPTNFSDLAITASTGYITVGTNTDKTGYSISGTLTTLDALDTAQDTQHSTTQSLVTTVDTVVDSISASLPTNFADLAITATTGLVSVGTNNDKTGYSISGTLTTLDALDTQQDTQHATTQASISALNNLSQVDIRTAVGLAAANLDTQLSTIDSVVDSNSSAIAALNDPTLDQIVDAVWDETVTGHNAVQSFGRYVRQIAEGLISVEGDINDLSATTTSFVTNLTETTNDHYLGKSLVFISGTLLGQARVVETYNGTTKTMTFDEPFTEAPADGDTFIILAPHVHTKTEIAQATTADMDANSTKLASILTDTAEIGTAGAGLTAIPWNASWDIEIESEVVDGLTIYGGATEASIAALNDLSQADIRTAVGLAAANLDTQLSTISGKTSQLTFTTANKVDSRVDNWAGQAATVSGTTLLPVVDIGSISDNTEAADDIEASARTIVKAAAISGTLTTTQMTTDLTETTDDHYNGRVIIWTTGQLKDQATNITDYDGSTKMLTFTAVTEAASVADEFIIV